MARGIRLEMNYEEMIRIMKSAPVMNELLRRAHRVQAAAGRGHMVTSRAGTTRARVSVITASEGARQREATDRTLTRALDAARG